MIVDTSVFVAIERGLVPRDAVIDHDDDLAIAAVSASELLVGVMRAGDEQRRAVRAARVDALLAVLPVLPFDLAVARQHAVLVAHVTQGGRPRGANDLMIAATALASHRTVVTLDRRGFDDLPGVQVRVL